MKRRIVLCVFVAHLLLVLFLSFDWSFLGGGYVGFFPTFALLYILSVPFVVLILAIVNFAALLIKHRATYFDAVAFVFGMIGEIAYLLPPLDFLEAPATGVLYMIVPCSVLAIFVLMIVKQIYFKKGGERYEKQK